MPQHAETEQPLLSKEELAATLNTDPRNPYVSVLYRLAGLQHVERAGDEEPGPFVEHLLDLLAVRAEWAHEGRKVPESGALIAVANHPFGVVDQLVVLGQILPQRPDAKLLLAPDQRTFDPLAPCVVRSEADAQAHLEQGGCLILFPAGNISRLSRDLKTVVDGRWSKALASLQANTGAAVLPLYIDGQSVDLMRLFEAVHPGLKRLPVIHKPLRKRRLKHGQRIIRVSMGTPLKPGNVAEFEHPSQITRFYRAKTYALASSVRVQRAWFVQSRRRAPQVAPLVAAIAPEDLRAELAKLPESALLFAQSGFRCYLAQHEHIPLMMQEIGRLREATFRAVGEGTNHAIDLDEFDLHYHHLFLWDESAQALAGAYRMGFGAQIMELFGKRGFYTSTLFRFRRAFRPVLEQSIELGRSFVPVAYQKHRMPLFLLWKGVLSQLVTHPQGRYVLGPVTISNQYNPLSKLLMTHYIHRNSVRDALSDAVQPRRPFRPKVVNGRKQDLEALLAAVGRDIRELDRVVADIEPDGAKVPVLLKRYLAQNARILAFNHDPKFNDALDGFMVLDLNDLPAETVANLQREFAS